MHSLSQKKNIGQMTLVMSALSKYKLYRFPYIERVYEIIKKFKLCAHFIKNNSEDDFIQVQLDKTC